MRPPRLQLLPGRPGFSFTVWAPGPALEGQPPTASSGDTPSTSQAPHSRDRTPATSGTWGSPELAAPRQRPGLPGPRAGGCPPSRWLPSTASSHRPVLGVIAAGDLAVADDMQPGDVFPEVAELGGPGLQRFCHRPRAQSPHWADPGTPGSSRGLALPRVCRALPRRLVPTSGPLCTSPSVRHTLLGTSRPDPRSPTLTPSG